MLLSHFNDCYSKEGKTVAGYGTEDYEKIHAGDTVTCVHPK